MQQDSIAQIFAVCGSFFQWAADEGLSNNANPIRAIKQKSQYKQRVVAGEKAKALTVLQWNFVLETAKLMADQVSAETDNELGDAEKEALETKRRYYERTLFIVATIYSM